MDLFRTKSIEQSIADTDEPEYQLKRSLTALDLTVFGVGVVIGAGIFTVAGRAAHTLAGPAVVVSFILAAICCALAAMCYAEFASTVPVSGSAYTFSYASLGEFFAWVIGWDLMLEMFLGASVVAQGWSAYLHVFLEKLGIILPTWLAYGASPFGETEGFDLMAMLLVAVLGVLVTMGIKESMRVNLALVGLKLFIVLFVIVAGISFINPANYSPFVPPAAPTEASAGWNASLIQAVFSSTPTAFGLGGIVTAAALVFFAYIGFDVVATTAEEAKNPRRDIPIGIIASLTICTVLYCAVALVVTGMVPYDQLSSSASLANAFAFHNQPWMATLISAGAVAGLTTVVLTLMVGATRLMFAMSRDNLLPMSWAKVHKTYRTPYRLTAGITIVVMLLAGLSPIGDLEEMVNIGTLSAFLLVSIGVPVLRRKRGDLKRAFTVPLSPVLPIVSALICLYLMLNLSLLTWARFLLWLAVGLVVYFAWGAWHSRVRTGAQLSPELEQALRENH